MFEIDISQDKITLPGLPVPPTTNHLYASHRGRRFKSKQYQRFIDEMQSYQLGLGNKNLVEIKKILTSWLYTSHFITIAQVTFLKRSRILTQKNTVKMFDTSNRIKALHDELAKLISVDDSHFQMSMCIKHPCPLDLPEQVVVLLEPYQVPFIDDKA